MREAQYDFELTEEIINNLEDRTRDYANLGTGKKKGVNRNKEFQKKCGIPLAQQHICNGRTRRKDRKEQKKIFEEIMEKEGVYSVLAS